MNTLPPLDAVCSSSGFSVHGPAAVLYCTCELATSHSPECRLATNGTLDRQAEHTDRRRFIEARRAEQWLRLDDIACEHAQQGPW